MSTLFSIPVIPDNEKFNGAHSWRNTGIHNALTKALNTHGLARLTIMHRLPTRPEAEQRRTDHFLNDGFFPGPYPNFIELVRPGTRMSLTRAEIGDDAGLMAEFNAGYLQGIADGEYAAGTVFSLADHEFIHTYGETEAARRLVSTDYKDDQDRDTKQTKAYQEDVTKFFTILNGFCNATGQAVYELYLPSATSLGQTARAYEVLSIKMGLNEASAAHILTAFHANRVRQGEVWADYFKRYDEFCVVLTRMDEEVSDTVKGQVLGKAVEAHQCIETTPYKYALDSYEIDNGSLQDFKDRIYSTELKLLTKFPFNSSGRRNKVGDSKGKVGGGRASASVAEEWDYEGNPSAAAVREVFCPGCNVNGHTLRDGNCPNFTWCTTCNWGHKNSEGCDNGAAKKAYLDLKGSRKTGGTGGRGAGGRGVGGRSGR